jgi:hypothetical protein
MRQIYEIQSDVSHVRRSGLRGMVSIPLRRAVYGRHPDPLARAHGAASTVLAVEATIIGVGDVLGAFYGGPYYVQVIKPIQEPNGQGRATDGPDGRLMRRLDRLRNTAQAARPGGVGSSARSIAVGVPRASRICGTPSGYAREGVA